MPNTRLWRTSLLPLLLLTLLLTGACATNPVSGEQDIVFMSEEQELALGRQTHAEIIDAFGEYDDPELQRYVNDIGKRLAAQSHRPELIYRFTVLDSADINAFALPGGYIYITRGLLAYLNSEAEMAAVLGHEIGHVTARHSVQQYSAAQMANIGATLTAIFVPGMNNQAAGSLMNIAGTAILRGYGREHELQADRLGAEYMAQSGYDPEKILDVLGVLKDQQVYAQKIAEREGREPQTYHGLFATHPDNDTRLQEIVGTARTLRTPGEPLIGRDAFLELIDGLVYGDSEKDGIVRDSSLYHADLGFALDFPAGWRIDNQPSQVIATAPDGGALLVLSAQDLNKRTSPGDYLRKNLGSGSTSAAEDLTINGLPAHTLRTSVRTQWGQRPARYTTLFFRDKAYTLIGISRDADAVGAHDDAFLPAMRSFRELDADERQLAQELRLRIVAANDRDYAELAAESPLAYYAEEQLRLLNGDYPDARPAPEQRLKIVE
ncbi:putative Zn-dependent protease [Methylohalomonas lacus]|uniref:Zn-dependent protease n=1 Tax=Methylohalomonas lacus TaxID=398773 RepID=A0AAE3HGS4_9GAMM|nr:M48 family metalloprotease [Methylohalomonas lacus]MCS3902055.1 putative Zn-dependent protease [Methylohalomonas lacus]